MEMEVINKEDEQHKEKVADVKQPLKDETEGRDLTWPQITPLNCQNEYFDAEDDLIAKFVSISLWFYTEEAEVSHYSTLMRPQEDVYAEAFQTDKSAGAHRPEIWKSLNMRLRDLWDNPDFVIS